MKGHYNIGKSETIVTTQNLSSVHNHFIVHQMSEIREKLGG